MKRALIIYGTSKGFPSRICHFAYIFIDLFYILDEIDVVRSADDITRHTTGPDGSHIKMKPVGKLFNFFKANREAFI